VSRELESRMTVWAVSTVWLTVIRHVRRATKMVVTKTAPWSINWYTPQRHACPTTILTVQTAKNTHREPPEVALLASRPTSGPVEPRLVLTSLGLLNWSMWLEVSFCSLPLSCSLVSCSPTGADAVLWWCASIVKPRGRRDLRNLENPAPVPEDDQRAEPRTETRVVFSPKFQNKARMLSIRFSFVHLSYWVCHGPASGRVNPLPINRYFMLGWGK
jgi:hypothetical protein